MTTATRRKWDVDRAIQLQDEINPDTGRNYSYEGIRRVLADEGVTVSVQAIGKAVQDERHKRQLPPPAFIANRLLPWEVPDWAHRDFTGKRLKAWAHRARGDELNDEQHGILASFQLYLERQGPDTVVWFDPRARRGEGGWVYRQRRRGEGTWYGLMIP